MTEPADQIAAGTSQLEVTYFAREQAIRTLKVALAQGRLTEDEHDARVAQASAARSSAELDAVTADLPDGLLARPPAPRDVRIGLGAIIAAVGVLAAIVLTNPDNYGAFMLALTALATLIVAPALTVGLMVDVRHQKRSARRLPR